MVSDRLATMPTRGTCLRVPPKSQEGPKPLGAGSARLQPGALSTGTAVGALAAYAAVCVTVIATVMASRNGLTPPSPAGDIWPWRTGPAGS